MTGEEKNMEIGMDAGDELLRQLFHLKQYEVPETARMTRNKQNIMRKVRQVSHDRRKSFGDLLEINFPWFFAEPKYGVALLFVAFAALQYVGANARHAAHSNTGIYTTPTDRFAAYEQPVGSVTNSSYAEVPSNFRLFHDRHGDGEVKWVANPTPATWRQ